MLLIVVKIVGKTRPYEYNIRKKSQLPMPIRLNLPGGLGGFIYPFNCCQDCW
jgi:predicted DNA-binding transcriptional regulator AlpA